MKLPHGGNGKGISWKNPLINPKGIDDITDHPVVHVSWDDAYICEVGWEKVAY